MISNDKIDRDVEIWATAFISATFSYVFAALGFTGKLDLMALGGFITVFGAMMTITSVIEKRASESIV